MNVVPRGRLSYFIHIYCRILVLSKYCDQMTAVRAKNKQYLYFFNFLYKVDCCLFHFCAYFNCAQEFCNSVKPIKKLLKFKKYR